MATLADYLTLIPAIQQAFYNNGVARPTVLQVEGIVIALLPQVEALIKATTPAPTPVAPVPVPPAPPVAPPPAPPEVTPYTSDQIVGFYEKYLGRAPENDAIVQEWMRNPNAEADIRTSAEAQTYAAAHPGVLFDHPWVGIVPVALRTVLEGGLAGPDGSNGQAVVNQMNTLGLGPDANGEFQAHHDGPTGLPTYGFPKFYVSYVPLAAGGGPIPNDGSGRSYYQIVVFG